MTTLRQKASRRSVAPRPAKGALTAEYALKQAVLLMLAEAPTGISQAMLQVRLDKTVETMIDKGQVSRRGLKLHLRKSGKGLAEILRTAFWRHITYEENWLRKGGQDYDGE